MAGYVKIYRKLRKWGWYGVPSVKDTFLHLLITAAFTPYEYKGITIERGAAIFSLDRLSAELGFSVQQIRTAIQKLKKTGEITVWTNRQFSVATIINYDDYQEDQADNTRITNVQQTNNKRLTNVQQTDNTIKEYIKEELKKERSIKERYGVLDNVLLTEKEYGKLKDQFADYQERIDRLSEYIASTGKTYKSHYATILSWARKDKKEKPPDKKRGSMFSSDGASFDLEKYEKAGLFND